MDDLRVSPEVLIPARELKWRFDPSGGPGGQHANKSATRVELTFDIGATTALTEAVRQRVLEHLGEDALDGVATVHASESRSQWRNRQVARRRLADLLNDAMRPPPPRRRATRPTRASKERRLAAKRSRSETKRLRRPPRNPD
jgi:ribosome-associated protein